GEILGLDTEFLQRFDAWKYRRAAVRRVVQVRPVEFVFVHLGAHSIEGHADGWPRGHDRVAGVLSGWRDLGAWNHVEHLVETAPDYRHLRQTRIVDNLAQGHVRLTQQGRFTADGERLAHVAHGHVEIESAAVADVHHHSRSDQFVEPGLDYPDLVRAVGKIGDDIIAGLVGENGSRES